LRSSIEAMILDYSNRRCELFSVTKVFYKHRRWIQFWCYCDWEGKENIVEKRFIIHCL